MQETGVQSLGWEDPLEKGKATHSVFWPGEFQGVAKSRTQVSDFHFTTENFPFWVVRVTSTPQSCTGRRAFPCHLVLPEPLGGLSTEMFGKH